MIIIAKMTWCGERLSARPKAHISAPLAEIIASALREIGVETLTEDVYVVCIDAEGAGVIHEGVQFILDIPIPSTDDTRSKISELRRILPEKINAIEHMKGRSWILSTELVATELRDISVETSVQQTPEVATTTG